MRTEHTPPEKVLNEQLITEMADFFDLLAKFDHEDKRKRAPADKDHQVKQLGS